MKDEQDAIIQLKQGDINGLEFLVHKYQLKAIRAAYLTTRDQALAEDITQAAFIRAFERIHQFNSELPFGPWFLRIVINDAIKSVDRSHRHFSFERSSDPDSFPLSDFLSYTNSSPEDVLAAKEKRQMVWNALERLSPAQRAVIVLHYYLGFKEVDIAYKMNSPLGTIKWRLHAARENIRALLNRPGGMVEREEKDELPHER